MLDATGAASFAAPSISSQTITNRRRRRPTGTPDPDAEVIALSPRTLMESDRYVCEICNQGFQRYQNLQMHLRRHKVPWNILKKDRPASGVCENKKRVYVCPDWSCLHHDPSHALGDLVGIKKHYRRKHSNHKNWICVKCSKAYAVQSDYKAHIKSCGTRGHSCDCGRVFSRVESFIEHQDICTHRSNWSGEQNPGLFSFMKHYAERSQNVRELHLLPCSTEENNAVDLELSIGVGSGRNGSEEGVFPAGRNCVMEMTAPVRDLIDKTMAEKAIADILRHRANIEMKIAELEWEKAKKIRQQAFGKLENARIVKGQSSTDLRSALLQLTCRGCIEQLQPSMAGPTPNEVPLSLSYVSSQTTQKECEPS